MSQPTPVLHTHVDIASVPDETIAATLARRAETTPDAVYCRFNDDVMTLGELARRVDRLADVLSAQGLRHGDRVALMLPSHPDHLVAIFALIKLGLVRVPVNVHLVGASLSHLFDHLAPKALLADRQYAEALGHDIDKVDQMLWRDEVFANRTNTDTDADAGTDKRTDAQHSVVVADDILALTPSSGTTGAPKGVLKSDRTLRAGAMAILRLTGAQPGDTFLLWEALHHGAGVAVAISALLGGTQLAMVERFSASRFWDDARRYGVTHIHYLGSVLPMLLNQPPRSDERQHSVRVAWGGGCPAELWMSFAQRFGVEMREGYGLSELTTFVTVNPDGPAGSIGKPLTYFDVALTDSVLAWSVWEAADYQATGIVPGPLGSAHRLVAPYRAYECAGGHWINVAGLHTRWRELCLLLEAPNLLNDPRFASESARYDNRELLDATLAPRFLTRGREDWLGALRALGIPCGPINDLSQTMSDAQFIARDMWRTLEQDGTAFKVINTPVRDEGGGAPGPSWPAPALGTHTLDVLRSVGIVEERLHALLTEGIIGAPAGDE